MRWRENFGWQGGLIAAYVLAMVVAWAWIVRPAPAFTCRAERADTREGVEIIAYPRGAVFSRPGVSVRCPR